MNAVHSCFYRKRTFSTVKVTPTPLTDPNSNYLEPYHFSVSHMLTEMVFGCRLSWIACVRLVVWWSTENCMVARGVRIVVKCRPGTRIDFKQVL